MRAVCFATVGLIRIRGLVINKSGDSHFIAQRIAGRQALMPKWNGPAIKLSTFAESKDHTISKPYNVLELITKEYTATDYVASMQIKEV